MKAPELNELISESHPKNNQFLSEELKKKIYELEQENIIYKNENNNLKEEITAIKKKEYESKTKLTLILTQNNNLRQENEKMAKDFQNMKLINQKLYQDNKTLISELNTKSNFSSKENNKIPEKDMNKILEEKDKIINDIRYELNISEEKIKKLFEDNKKLNDMNNVLLKEKEENCTEYQLMNDRIEELNEEINIKNELIKKLENDNYEIKQTVEDNNKEKITLNDINEKLKDDNKELIMNLNELKNQIIIFEEKNNSLLIEIEKKEQLIKEYKEKYIEQERQISSLMNKYNTIINKNKDSIILMNNIKAKNFELYNKYANDKIKLEEIKNIYKDDIPLDEFLSEFKEKFNIKYNNINNEFDNNISDESDENNINISPNDKYSQYIDKDKNYRNFRNYMNDTKYKEEMTMDKKYDFLFENKNKKYVN